MNHQKEKEAIIYLESVAALAKALALQLNNGSLWEGDAETQLEQIKNHLDKASKCFRRY